jgi:multimeric flavodoxin WrbA
VENLKRIIVILGGGRTNGNTVQLVEAFMKGATEAGHHVELVSLNKLNVNGCTGCNACRYGKPQISKTTHLSEAYTFGKTIYE